MIASHEGIDDVQQIGLNKYAYADHIARGLGVDFLKDVTRQQKTRIARMIVGEFANTHCLSCGRSKLRQRKVLTWMILVDDLNRHSDLNVLRIDIDDVTADKGPFV